MPPFRRGDGDDVAIRQFEDARPSRPHQRRQRILHEALVVGAP
jgi:hypothetical protein